MLMAIVTAGTTMTVAIVLMRAAIAMMFRLTVVAI
jgi:hypothetical protein